MQEEYGNWQEAHPEEFLNPVELEALRLINEGSKFRLSDALGVYLSDYPGAGLGNDVVALICAFQGRPGQTASGPYDFVHDRLANGGQLKLLRVLDEYTRECLAIEVGKSLRNQDVILTLSRLMRIHGKPAFIRSDNGGEFTATAVMKWVA